MWQNRQLRFFNVIALTPDFAATRALGTLIQTANVEQSKSRIVYFLDCTLVNLRRGDSLELTRELTFRF